MPAPVSKLPKPVVFICWLFITVGILGLVYHASEFNVQSPFETDVLLAILVRTLAIVGGVLLLRGVGWARWLLISWVAYHVILSAMHGVYELIFHSVILVGVTYLLFRPQTLAYFRRSDADVDDHPKPQP